MKKFLSFLVMMLAVCSMQAQSVLMVDGKIIDKTLEEVTMDLEVPGNMKVKFTDGFVASYNMNLVEFHPNGVMITGDANRDGQVNVTDIVAAVNKIMEKPSADFNATAADVNFDGEVNVTDIVGMVNIIMKSGTQNVRELMSTLRRNGFVF
ncbi:MAG: dockerin type I repeat-containing protein [Prevotella sp.]|nr:dockerin type I repeat-containing protein [Prevotella sp.]